MNKIILFLLISTFTQSAYSQTLCDTVPVNSYELKGNQYKDWNTIYSTWLNSEFKQILKKYNLRLNCGSCVSVYIDVIFTIDCNGKVNDYTITKDNICGNKATQEQIKSFMKYFKLIVFPDNLRNIRIKTKLGNGLKC